MRILLHARFGDGGWDAVATGCKAGGHTVVWQNPSVWRSDCLDRRADVAIVHGLSGNASAIHAAYRRLGVPVWIVDLPRLREELDAIGVYLDSLHWLPPVPHGRAAVCQSPIAKRTKDVALLIGQKPGDFAHGMDATRMARWLRDTVTRIRTATGLPVALRPHPLASAMPMPEDLYGADEIILPDHPVRDDLARTAVCVTYNSTAGWEAIAAGVPVVALDPSAAYAAFATRLDRPASLPAARRAEALALAASTQWTMEELREPATIDWLFAHHASHRLAGAA